jgi:hypothetical protein
MYIKLGKTNLNYSTSLDDYIIVSEVVDSQLSYENPVLVRTKDELDIWFGKEFSDRSYFDELLQSGVTLYLYKPVLSSNLEDENYVDLSEYNEDLGVYYSLDEIENPQLKTIYTTQKDNERYIYLDSGFLNIDLLPQNIDNISSSLNNRDTLLITSSGQVCHPEYSLSDLGAFSYTPEITYLDDYSEFNNETDSIAFRLKYTGGSETQELRPGYIIISNLSQSLNLYYQDKNGYKKYIYLNGDLVIAPEDLDLSGYIDSGNRYTDPEEIVNPSPGVIYRVYENYFNNPEIGYLCYTGSLPQNDDEYTAPYTFNTYETITTFSDLIRVYRDTLGYTCKQINNTEYLIYSGEGYITKITHFFTYPDIEIENDFRTNNNLLYNYYKDNTKIKFWSKTIGTCDEPVKVKIENIKDDTARITLSRYDYYEVFEGPLYPGEDEERLDYAISKYSRLVYCEFIPGTLKPKYNLPATNNVIKCSEFFIKFSDSILVTGNVEVNVKRTGRKTYALDINSQNSNLVYKICGDVESTGYIDEAKFYCFGLMEGEFELLGGCKEEQGKDEYKKGLEYMFDSNKINVYPDFLFIPDKYKYPDNPEDQFLEIAKEYNLQVLLENNETDYINNYLDKDNRLIYFYNPVQINYEKRPGYYLHVLGVIGNVFSMSSRYIIYDTPGNGYEEPELELEKYKSNYLVYNNHMYFYKKYFSGKDYNCTIWMRFVLGKIERELNKNKGYFLTQKHMGQVRNVIEGILRRIVSSFSIVRSITLTKFIPELTKNYLSIGIETEINDLVDKNIKLNLTINI